MAATIVFAVPVNVKPAFAVVGVNLYHTSCVIAVGLQPVIGIAAFTEADAVAPTIVLATALAIFKSALKLSVTAPDVSSLAGACAFAAPATSNNVTAISNPLVRPRAKAINRVDIFINFGLI